MQHKQKVRFNRENRHNQKNDITKRNGIKENTMKKLLVAGAALAVSISTQASFDGATVQATYYFPDTNTVLDQEQAVVGPGVEFTTFPDGDPRTNIDISATNIYITYNSASSWTTASFNGEFFQGLTPLPTITGASFNPATNMAGLDASRLSFTADSISINWNGLPFDENTVVSVDVQFGAAPSATAVPTLPAYALGLTMLGLMLAALRRLRAAR